MKLEFIGLGAILLGGSLGDTMLTWTFMQAAGSMRDLVPAFVWAIWSNSLFEGGTFLAAGLIFFGLTFRNSRRGRQLMLTTAGSAFVLAFAAALWVDNLAALGLLFPALHIDIDTANYRSIFIICFFLADLSMGTSAILYTAHIGIKRGYAYGIGITRALSLLCAAYGLVTALSDVF